jgi:catechol 2,3-dioxygenase-like lactoylglutathione lyase family enzyme
MLVALGGCLSHIVSLVSLSFFTTETNELRYILLKQCDDSFTQVHKPPLNHIGLWVDDLSTAVAWMQEQGVRFTPGGIRKGAAGHDVAFIHPKGSEDQPISGNGVLIELVQAPEKVIQAFGKKGD